MSIPWACLIFEWNQLFLNMQITLLAIGKTDKSELEELISVYEKRLKHYVKFQMEIIPDIKNRKNLSEAQQKEKEGELILAQLQPTDTLILLDEKGKQYTSMDFAQFLQKQMNSGIKNLVLVIGGPYGFSDAIYAKSSGKISLSKMTFSHQMIRLFIVEQIYRGFTILRNEPYHHQ
ncbi:23S rRNA (pseudouridine1915-N3)-methyltransferase [Flagellimonas zhangzhouensis]|uniref:Ribosomal RNA large subunit methyltransferase H n=2 Tax=Flagellimonas zhangzhouensis TaxID=1073328 RepID=A0A1H2RY92_9FLAO|nr:23S rRNA (pseudouridine1915-N3)-methyltransferase [Allomuricauda zhangzhouensis]SDW23579.1 23S rRNA (pseudouridine1915-N3)-methyltransferase [Allomuricauda zhangzhouensis]